MNETSAKNDNAAKAQTAPVEVSQSLTLADNVRNDEGVENRIIRTNEDEDVDIESDNVDMEVSVPTNETGDYAHLDISKVEAFDNEDKFPIKIEHVDIDVEENCWYNFFYNSPLEVFFQR